MFLCCCPMLEDCWSIDTQLRINRMPYNYYDNRLQSIVGLSNCWFGVGRGRAAAALLPVTGTLLSLLYRFPHSDPFGWPDPDSDCVVYMCRDQGYLQVAQQFPLCRRIINTIILDCV